MLTSKVAKRYAQGLLSFTQETGNTENVAGEMKDLLKILETSRDLQNLFASPIIDEKKKSAIAAEIFKDFSPVSQNIIALVIKHGREKQLQGIAHEFVQKVEQLSGVQRVKLTVAAGLSAENRQRILEASPLVRKDKKYEVETAVDPKILGGYILRVGDQQIDASVKSQLAKLGKEFQLN